MFKKLPHPASTKLLMIFNACLLQSYWPSRWKIGVIAIPKAGKNPENSDNYRHILLLDVTGKLLEIMLKAKLATFAEIGQHLNPEQFGFRSGRSAPQQVLRVVNEMRKHKLMRRSTGILLMDVAKAFDATENWHPNVSGENPARLAVRQTILSRFGGRHIIDQKCTGGGTTGIISLTSAIRAVRRGHTISTTMHISGVRRRYRSPRTLNPGSWNSFKAAKRLPNHQRLLHTLAHPSVPQQN